MNWHGEILGYLFAVPVGGFMIGLVSRKALHQIGMPQKGKVDPTGKAVDSDAMANPWTAAYVGIVERILFLAALQFEIPEFIGFWLALKVAGQWNRWADRRKIFQVFLIGSGLSILYALVGFKIIGWVECGANMELAIIPISVILFSLVLWGHLRFFVQEK